MKKYLITDEPTEELELRVEDGRYTLIQTYKTPDGERRKVVIMNKREVLELHQAIGKEIRGE